MFSTTSKTKLTMMARKTSGTKSNYSSYKNGFKVNASSFSDTKCMQAIGFSPIQDLRRFARDSRARTVAAWLECTWRYRWANSEKLSLPVPLTLTLTSYPPRFATLALTLKSLLAQSVRATNVVLWIASGDVKLLPSSVRHLEEFGLTIRSCRDLRSYKKIVPALQEFGENILVIADDDVYYRREWLKTLLSTFKLGSKEVLCIRSHRIAFDLNGNPKPYEHWRFETDSTDPSPYIFPTGIGGVVYEPGIFFSHVTDVDRFSRLCPTADDVWLYWMASLNGATFRKVGRRERMINWPGSQDVSLFSENSSANDGQIGNMIAEYGFPPTWSSQGPCLPGPTRP